MTNFLKHKMRGKSAGEIAGIIIFGTIFIVGLAILFGFIIMWLWNWLMPEIFGLPMLSYWQAVGVFVLFKILLGSMGDCSSSSKSNDSKCKDDSKGKFSKWKHYDKFWEEEGDIAYKKYLERLNNDTNTTEE